MKTHWDSVHFLFMGLSQTGFGWTDIFDIEFFLVYRAICSPLCRQLLHICSFPSLEIVTKPVTSYMMFWSLPNTHTCTVTLVAHTSSLSWAGMCLFWLNEAVKIRAPLKSILVIFPHKHRPYPICIFCIGDIATPGAFWTKFQFWFYHFPVTRTWASYVAFVYLSIPNYKIGTLFSISEPVGKIKLANSCKTIVKAGLRISCATNVNLLFLSYFKYVLKNLYTPWCLSLNI